MKKLRSLLALVCLCALLPSLPLPTLAAETDTAPETEETQEELPTIPALADMPFGTVSIYNGCRTIEGMVPLAGKDKKLESAQSAFLYEVNTGTVVYSYNPDMKVAPGSLTKLITAAVAIERCQLDEMVTLTGDIHNYPEGGLHYDLRTGEELSVETLLMIILHQGGNDAAIGLADYVAGNQPNFVKLMNEWAKNAGCTSTEFGTVTGLTNIPSTTTARDMAKMMVKVMENETLTELMAQMSYNVPASNKHPIGEDGKTGKRSFRSNNYLLDKGTIEDFYDTRVRGGAVSYVPDYGASMVAWANDATPSWLLPEETTPTETVSDDPAAASEETEPTEAEPQETSRTMDYVAVVMNCQRTFNERERVQYYGNFNEMTKLLKLGFGSYKYNRIVYDGMALEQVPVLGGECSVVGEARENIDSIVPANAHMDNIYRVFTAKDNLKAPIQAGDEIGTMQLTYRESVLAETKVYAMGGVTAAGKNGITIRSTASRDGESGGVLSVIGTIVVVIVGLGAAYLTFNAYMRARIRAKRRQRRSDRRRTR